ncbi:MAG: tetrahydrofolate synthase [Treponema sp.]|jgi:dihydrofolate synthase/folylpolyglutamate synthase|nr:tetrahydrofolate synthase [Treponema sp.]
MPLTELLTGEPGEFSGSSGVFAWINRFIGLGRGQSHKSFRLDRMKVLCDLAGNPETAAPAIHVAGSKGKGSVTGMIAAILNAAGCKAARYSSPDVMEKRERITLGNYFFDETVYVEAGKELAQLVKKLYSRGGAGAHLFDPSREDGEIVTFFELITLYFFLCARYARCNALVVETGMGGRLDATNIVSPQAAVITLIELEHTEYLGNTLEAVAGEKAGIIKAHTPLVLAAQTDEALAVFRREALAKDAPLLYFPDIAEVRDIRVCKTGTQFDLRLPRGNLGRFSVKIPGEVQAYNAGLAALAVQQVYPRIGAEEIRRGLEDFSLPARFEQIMENPELVIDGAHTPKSAEQCRDTFLSLYGGGGILIFGCTAGKSAAAMAEIFAPHFSRIIITTPGTFKKSNPGELYRIFGEKLRGNTELLLIPDTVRAVELALEKSSGLPVLGAGSFYLAAEIRKYILSRNR